MGDQATGQAPIRVGISACVLGQRVRYDGGHKEDRFLTGTLARFVEFVPVCPEVEVGMGTPRETVRLERAPDGPPRMVAPKSGTDHTTSMRRYAKRRARELQALELCGYVLKSGSPSCGMERVRVYDHDGMPNKNGRGLFAEALMEHLPLLPVEEEGRLNDPKLRDNFFVRLFAYRRLKDLFSSRWRTGDLVRFHTAEKLLLMAHDVKGYRHLGKLVADPKAVGRKALAEEYGRVYMQSLRKHATTSKQVNVLQHILGYFKKLLTPEERRELVELIEDYRGGLVPLIVPVTLLRHHVRLHGVEYLAGQVYLQPHPKELMLRNHV
jgi:uncharacterized protein YbgA (DUF1722 family)/uncharacterized protein YbbK (DUF523 family)